MSDRNRRGRCLGAALLTAAMLAGCVPQEPPATEPTQTETAYEGPVTQVAAPVSAVCHRPDGTLYWHLTCRYDSLGNLVRVIRHGADGAVQDDYSYIYNSQGQIEKISAQEGLDVVKYTYNVSGSRVREQHGLERLEYAYDSLGNIQVLNKYASDILERYTTYTYDDRNLLIQAQDYDSSGLLLSHACYEYDEKGRLIAEQLYTKSGVLPTVTRYGYDINGSLIREEKFSRDGELQSEVHYSCDSAGNRLSVSRYDKDGKLMWWVEFSYGEVSIPEENQAASAEARQEILGF